METSLRSRWLLLGWTLLLCLPGAAATQAKLPRIDPAGIDGALLICGRGAVSMAAVEEFFELAGETKAKIVVVLAGSDKFSKMLIEHLSKQAESAKAPAVQVLRVPKDKREMEDLSKALDQATGVWWAGEEFLEWEHIPKGTTLEKSCRDVMKRGGVIGGSGLASGLMGIDGLYFYSGPRRLLPDAVIEIRPAGRRTFSIAVKAAQLNRGGVGYEIDEGEAMLVKGRTIRVIGEGKVKICVASGSGRVREITLQGKQREDLTALRRAARDAADEPPFPPARPEPPVVEKGTLVIVGGGGSPDGLYRKFVEFAGGPDKAHIVIFPTANPDPIPKRDGVVDIFRKAGAKHVTVLKGRSLAEVDSKEYHTVLEKATGLWFDGGRQWRYVDAYENTESLALMRAVLSGGGVIGGTSAGATIQGDYLCRGGVFDNFAIRYEGYERGLGFLKGVAIDQHFSQRKRQADMTSLMKTYPQFLGIGLDEATAITVQGSVAEVSGKGKAYFYDARRKIAKGEPDYEALPAGGRYDLKSRKILEKHKGS